MGEFVDPRDGLDAIMNVKISIVTETRFKPYPARRISLY